MEFLLVARIFDTLEKTASRLAITGELAKLFAQAGKGEIRELAYLCQGELVPPHRGIQLGMGDKLAEQAIAIVSGKSIPEIEKDYRKTGDLGETAQEFTREKQQKSLHAEALSVHKVYDNFYKIATESGEGSQDAKIKMLAELLSNSRESEAKTIIRFVTGKMRIGIGEPTILDALSLMAAGDKSLRPRIEHAYNFTGDIGLVAETFLSKGLDELDKIKPEPFNPVMPALAERLPGAKEIIEKLGKCAVEGKYDGLRLQVHKKGGKVEIYTRRQEVVTRMFPDIVAAAKTQIKADNAIFEGEAIAFNEKTGKFLPFQQTIQRKRKYEVAEKTRELPLKLFAFDLIEENGNDTTGLPYAARRKKLSQMISKGKTIEPAQAIMVETAKQLDDYFKKCVDAGLEGIIAKDLKSPYVAGARKFAWIKLKKSYQTELADTFDLAIIGYYYGKGKRTEFGFGGLLAAAYDPQNREYKSLAKIGTGFSEEQMQFFSDTLSKIKAKQKPPNVVSLLEPDEWVRPEYVVEVRADEITKSPIHACAMRRNEKTGENEGLALRFPRLMRLRGDKKPEDATTEEEILEMFEMQGRK
ncbi:MAG: ATP-dependent DNA ligase [Candidatus Micrarchaeia archaeon]|jgi:DNA ligase-1